MQIVSNILSRKLNKTPLNNISSRVSKINNIDSSLIKSLLLSPSSGEGVFGFEQIVNGQFSELYMFIPSIMHLPKYGITKTNWNWFKDNKEYIAGYEAYTTKSLCFPLTISNGQSILHEISILSNQLNDAEIFTQILLSKRIDDWWGIAKNQYEDYLNGQDHPATGRIERKIQNKITGILDKVANFQVEREYVEEIEQKIREEGYRFELRFLIYSKDKRQRSSLIYPIEEILRKSDFYNSLRLYKTRKLDSFIDDILERKLNKAYTNQILSESEILSLLTSDGIQINTQPQTIEKKEIVETPTTSLIDTLPIGKKINRVIDENEIAESFSDALKEVKLIERKITPVTIQSGATLQIITFKLPKGVKFSTIKKNLEDVQALLGVESLDVVQGKEAGTISFLVPQEERDVIYLKELLESVEFNEFKQKNPLPFCIGFDILGNPLFECLSRIRHLLIAGTSGGGKSVFLNQIILTLLLMCKPNEIIMFLVDPKMVELSGFEGFKQVQKVITDMGEATKLFDTLVNEMEERYKFLKEKGYKTIANYNEDHPNSKKPYIVCAVDEFADLIMINPDIEKYIVRLGQKARASGIHLIIATQRPSVDVITGLIKANISSRIAFSTSSQVDSRTILDANGAEKLLGLGDGIAKVEGWKSEFVRFQSPVITLSDKEEDEIYDKLKKMIDGESQEIKIVEIAKEEPIDKLKRIIANTGETRVTPLRKEMEMQMDTVQELMHQLVDEGWLIKHKAKNKGYELVASEEELNKWRDKKREDKDKEIKDEDIE